jgi:hypothetical protein
VDTKPKPEPDDKEQSERFKETARQLEVDESGEAFDRALNVIKHRKATNTGETNKLTNTPPKK